MTPNLTLRDTCIAPMLFDVILFIIISAALPCSFFFAPWLSMMTQHILICPLFNLTSSRYPCDVAYQHPQQECHQIKLALWPPESSNGSPQKNQLILNSSMGSWIWELESQWGRKHGAPENFRTGKPEITFSARLKGNLKCEAPFHTHKTKQKTN